MIKQVLSKQWEDASSVRDLCNEQMEPFLVATISDNKMIAKVNQMLSRDFLLPASLLHLKRIRKCDDGTIKVCIVPTKSAVCENSRDMLDDALSQQCDASVSVCLSDPEVILLPGHPPISNEEAKYWSSKYWPVFFNAKSAGLLFKPTVMPTPLDNSETCVAEKWITYIQEKLDENKGTSNYAVIINPISNEIVAESSDAPSNRCAIHHAVMLALKYSAVRISSARKLYNTSSRELKKRKITEANSVFPNFDPVDTYLCQGFDIYIVREPCEMCSMALVHSRIRRAFYLLANPTKGGLGSVEKLHCHAQLNHRFLVYKFQT